MPGKRVRVSATGRRTAVWRGRYRTAAGREVERHFTRKADAEEWERAGRAAVRATGGKTRLTTYAERWRGHQVQHRPETARRVEAILRLHVIPALGDRPVAAVTRDDLGELVTRWSASAAPRTVRQRYAVLTGLFGAAVDDGLVAASPCRRVRLPRVESALVVPLTAAQVARLADAVPPAVRPLVFAGAGLGVRVSEGLGLTEDRLRHDRGDVLVDRQQAPRPPYELAPLKNSRRTAHRAVPAPAELLDYLGRLAAPGSGARVCWRPDGSPLTARAVSWHVARAVVAERLPAGTRFHSLRHFYASTLIEAGESVAVVAERLGDTPAEVLGTYTHLFAAASGRTREIVSAALTVPETGR